MRLSIVSRKIAGPLYGKNPDRVLKIFTDEVRSLFPDWSVVIRDLYDYKVIRLSRGERKVIFTLSIKKDKEPSVKVDFSEGGHYTQVNDTLRGESRIFLRHLADAMRQIGNLGFYIEYAPSERSLSPTTGESRYNPHRESLYYAGMKEAELEPYASEDESYPSVHQFKWGKYPPSEQGLINQKRFYDAYMAARKLLIAHAHKGFRDALREAAGQMAYDLGVKYEAFLQSPWYWKLKGIVEKLREGSLSRERWVRPKKKTSSRISLLSKKIAGPLYKEYNKAFNIFQRVIEDNFSTDEIKKIRPEGAIIRDSDGNHLHLTLGSAGGEPMVRVDFTDPYYSYSVVKPQLTAEGVRFLRKISKFLKELRSKGLYINYSPMGESEVRGRGTKPSDRRESIYQKDLTRGGAQPYMEASDSPAPKNLHWGNYPHGNDRFQSQAEIYAAFVKVKRWVNRVLDKVSWRGIKDKNLFYRRLSREAMRKLQLLSGQEIVDANRWYREIDNYIRLKVNTEVSL